MNLIPFKNGIFFLVLMAVQDMQLAGDTYKVLDYAEDCDCCAVHILFADYGEVK